jgi:hypothetical protein
VLKNEHGDWASICRPEGRSLAACADARYVSKIRCCDPKIVPIQTDSYSVPHLTELKNACADRISSYRTCLDANASLSNETLGETCAEPLKALWECTERTMGEIEAKEGASAKASGSSSDSERRMV